MKSLFKREVPAETEGVKPIAVDGDVGLTVIEQYGGVPGALGTFRWWS